MASGNDSVIFEEGVNNKSDEKPGRKRFKKGSSAAEGEEEEDVNLASMMKEVLKEMKELKSEISGITIRLREEMLEMKEDLRREVREMMREELSTLNNKFSKRIEDSSSEIKYELRDLDRRVSDISNKLEKEIRESSETENKLKYLNSEVSNSKKRERELQWKAIDNEARNRRNNLLFFGIREEKGEDCFRSAEDFIKNELKISQPVVLQRAHRLGKPTPPNAIGQRVSQPRPIILNFLDFRQREIVWASRFQLRHPFGISEDFPWEVRKARESLQPELREMKRNNKKCAIVWPARLLCEGQIVKEVDITQHYRA